MVFTDIYYNSVKSYLIPFYNADDTVNNTDNGFLILENITGSGSPMPWFQYVVDVCPVNSAADCSFKCTVMESCTLMFMEGTSCFLGRTDFSSGAGSTILGARNISIDRRK